jgi:CrcB protein
LNSWLAVLYVGLGGFLGAAARYGLSLATAGLSMVIPYGTLLANIIGCLLIGVILSLATQSDAVTPGARLFLATGLCGGFTTMSSFVFELASLTRAGDFAIAALYLSVTLIGSIVFFYVGMMLVQLLRT